MEKRRICPSNFSPIFLDLFAGAGGLSEGFIRAGFQPIAHVEMNSSACFTLKTRMVRHWLFNQKKEDIYYDYLSGKISRTELYKNVPEEVLTSVINREINNDTLPEIFEKTDKLIGNKHLDLIIGGPPCQAYSLVGRARSLNNMRGDIRNYLYRHYVRFLEKYQPDYFVFENVTGLLSAKNENQELYFDMMKESFKTAGYTIEYRILSAKDYGVLQNRKRIIMVGKKGEQAEFFPEPEKWFPDVKVSEIFTDLPEINAGEGSFSPCKMKSYSGTWLYESKIRNENTPVTFHQSRTNNSQDLAIYRLAVELWNTDKKRLNYNALPEELKTHTNRNSFTDRFKVVAADLPYSHTVVAHIAKDGHYYIHPDINQNRSITPREAARLQTFPDDYYFENVTEIPSRTTAFQQIGNAVPVLMSEKIAMKLKEKMYAEQV